MGLLYLGGPTIQEVGGEIMMGLSIYRVAVIDGSLYSRFYGIIILVNLTFTDLPYSSSFSFSSFSG